MIYWFKRKIQQIKKVLRFLPVLWQTYNFDYRYAIDLFKLQLEDTAKYLESDKAMTADAKVNAQKVRTIIKLMDKVYEEEYAVEYQDRLEEKYGKNVLDWNFVPIKEKEGYSSLNYEYESWSNREEVQKDLDLWFKESREKQKRAHKLLWKLIENNIQKWWD